MPYHDPARQLRHRRARDHNRSSVAAELDAARRSRQGTRATCTVSPPLRVKPRTDAPQDTEIARWFATEVHPHEPALRSYLRAHFPTLRDIDDLVQEAYARVIQARHNGRV